MEIFVITLVAPVDDLCGLEPHPDLGDWEATRPSRRLHDRQKDSKTFREAPGQTGRVHTWTLQVKLEYLSVTPREFRL